MGVVNATPDSFSGDGRLDPDAACEHAHELARQGADIIDVGAESTRPGAEAVAPADEWRRLGPLLARLSQGAPAHPRLSTPLSVDTRHPETMLRAADLGVSYINDVGGGAPLPVLDRLATYPGLRYICMHMHGTPKSMQKEPLSQAEAVTTVSAFFRERYATLRQAGFPDDGIWLDPGIGFGKTDAANVALMREIGAWTRAGFRIAVGVSRKSLLGRMLGLAAPQDRDPPSKTLELGLAMLGAGLIRTHDVRRLRPLLDLLGSSVRASSAAPEPEAPGP